MTDKKTTPSKKAVPVMPLSGDSNGRQSEPNNKTIDGVLEIRDGHGVLRSEGENGHKDAYISNSQIKRFRLREGDVIAGPAREPKDNERYWGLLKVTTINELPVEEFLKLDRKEFHQLTPVYPDEKIMLETGPEPLSLRMIDLVAPIGKGQRSLIVSPPKAGKTTLLIDTAIPSQSGSRSLDRSLRNHCIIQAPTYQGTHTFYFVGTFLSCLHELKG